MREEGRGGGAAGIRTRVPLQPLKSSMAEKISTFQPVKTPCRSKFIQKDEMHEEQGAAERRCYGLTPTPAPHLPMTHEVWEAEGLGLKE